MAAATLTANFTESLPPGIAGVKLTQTAATSTYVCPYFHQIIAVAANNESGTTADGVDVSWSGRTITIVTVGATDVVDLLIAGRG